MGEGSREEREENGMDTNASKQRHFELMGLEIPFPFFRETRKGSFPFTVSFQEE